MKIIFGFALLSFAAIAKDKECALAKFVQDDPAVRSAQLKTELTASLAAECPSADAIKKVEARNDFAIALYRETPTLEVVYGLSYENDAVGTIHDLVSIGEKTEVLFANAGVGTEPREYDFLEKLVVEQVSKDRQPITEDQTRKLRAKLKLRYLKGKVALELSSNKVAVVDLKLSPKCHGKGSTLEIVNGIQVAKVMILSFRGPMMLADQHAGADVHCSEGLLAMRVDTRAKRGFITPLRYVDSKKFDFNLK